MREIKRLRWLPAPPGAVVVEFADGTTSLMPEKEASAEFRRQDEERRSRQRRAAPTLNRLFDNLVEKR